MKKLTLLLCSIVILVFPLFAGGKKEAPKAEAEKVEITEPVTIQFWHAMGGARIDLIQGIVDDFMKKNPNITVDVQYTGSYNDTLNKVKAAYKAGQCAAGVSYL